MGRVAVDVGRGGGSGGGDGSGGGHGGTGISHGSLGGFLCWNGSLSGGGGGDVCTTTSRLVQGGL